MKSRASPPSLPAPYKVLGLCFYGIFKHEMNLLDIIFPKRCVACGKIGSYLCEQGKRKIKVAATFCPVCLKGAVGGTTHERCKGKHSLDGLICLFSYKTPIKEIIHELKYRFVRDLLSIVEKEIKKVARELGTDIGIGCEDMKITL